MNRHTMNEGFLGKPAAAQARKAEPSRRPAAAQASAPAAFQVQAIPGKGLGLVAQHN